MRGGTYENVSKTYHKLIFEPVTGKSPFIWTSNPLFLEKQMRLSGGRYN